jgi:3-oxoacyl-[acyl-carrier protein] reductase
MSPEHTRPVALITGVGRAEGIGAGIARRLAPTHDLALVYLSAYDERVHGGAGDLAQISEELETLGAQVTLIECDLADAEAAASVASRAPRPASILILSHCESVDSSILDTTVESFDRHYAVNVRASWLLIRGFAGQTPGHGRIIALTSDHTVHNLPYGATKGALDRVVIAAARELADLRITANVLSPGPIDTGWMTEEIRAAGRAQTPAGRLGTPDDVAAVITFLCSEEGGWVNGQLIKADGGFSS